MNADSPILHVLYVEDNAQDADLTCRTLRRSAPHVEIETVRSLAAARARLEGAEAATAGGAGPPADGAPRLPDALLIDVRLADGNGLELLGEVRSRALPV